MEVFAACSDWLLLIGGTAVQSYGMPRMTFDLRSALGEVGYVVDDHRPTFTRYRHMRNRRPIVDAMRVEAGTLAKLWAESRLVTILGCPVRVPAPLHLIAMKLHALKQQPDREYKDWEDIRFLWEHHSASWTRDALATIIERYASEKYAAKLRDHL